MCQHYSVCLPPLVLLLHVSIQPQPPPLPHPQVFAWGAGEYGKLGLGDEEKHTSPVLIEELQVAVAVAVGGWRFGVWGLVSRVLFSRLRCRARA